MASISQLKISQIDTRLDNLTKKQSYGLPVTPGLLVPELCKQYDTDTCLVEYRYPLTLAETAQVARAADFEQRVSQSGIVVGRQQSKEARLSQASSEAAASARAARQRQMEHEAQQEVPLAPFRPDWRFWTGITLSGLGLFLYRNR